jgi:hypothetical protein
MRDLFSTYAPALRLRNQKISDCDLSDPQSLVAHLGAVQAQDYAMSKWALGIRLPGATDATIEAALDAGDIVRTHVLRPTWHLVSGKDVRWMLALTGKHIKALSVGRDRDLGIDDALYNRTNDLIAKALQGGKQLTRAEVMQELEKGGVKTDSSRAVHFMMNAELDAIVCNGARRGKEMTYALMDEKIPKGLVMSREESLATLAQRYFSSHGPATLHDFQWWSGLPMSAARAGWEDIKSKLQSVDWEGKTYFFDKDSPAAGNDRESVIFLPAFDEYIVSYKNRNAVFDSQWQKEAITSNGIFKPVIVVNGQVTGIWKRTVQKNKVVVEPFFFDAKNTLPPEVTERAMQPFGAFLDLPVVVRSIEHGA